MDNHFYGPVTIGTKMEITVEAGGTYIHKKIESGATYIENQTGADSEAEKAKARQTVEDDTPDAATNEELAKYKDSKLLPYVINTQYPLVYIKNLHEKIKKEMQLEQRVVYIVEAVKNKKLSKLLPYEVFTKEFGKVSKAAYYKWRNKSAIVEVKN